ncbi:MAG: glycosyltransferase [Bacteroidetes bacterium]|nr:glycosyltransferase [Bacteroidota bacterium]
MLTLITICYNAERTIEDTLKSVLDQKIDFPFEHLIIDGKSTDNTLEVIAVHKNDNTRLISEPDTGLYNALNKGIRVAKGDIIGLLHADDLLATNTILSDIYQLFEAANFDGVYGDLNYVSAENTNKIIRKWRSKPFQKRNLNFGWMPAHPTLFLRKSVFEILGNYDENFKIAADYDFMLRILKDDHLKFHYYPKLITLMRIGGASSATANLKQKMFEDLRAMRNNHIFSPLFTLLLKNFRKIIQFL